MCGIAGIVNLNGKPVDKDLIVRMTNTLNHRGPDDEGSFYSNDIRQTSSSSIGVGLGHKRLSIIDLSEAGRQPLSNEDGTVWLVCNGEIYNYKELAKEVESKGHKLKSKTDSEVIIHLYEEYGDNFVPRLQGMFAFAIWDSRKKRAIIARDRVGIKPLYYYFKDGVFIFASEIKAILSNDCVKREIDTLSLNQYLSFLYTPAPKTIFKDILKAEPGSLLVLEDGRLHESQYWDLVIQNNVDTHKSEDVYVDTIYDLLKEAINARMMSDVPLGAFLSGGIDSSVIVAIMSELSATPIKTFSIGFGREERHYSELEHAKVIADLFKTDHREFVLKSDIVELLPTVVSHFDEPFANPTSVLMYLLSQETKKHVSVALSGTGGDEAFAGYTRYAGMKLSENAQMVPKSLRKFLNFAAENIPESSNGKHFGRRLKRFVNGSLMQPEERYASWMSVFNDDLKSELFSSDVFRGGVDEYLRSYFNNPGILNSQNKVFYTDVKTYLPNNQLEYVDKMSMAHALEVRVPFCDHKLLEYSASIPYNLKIKGLNTKHLLKRAAAKILPEEIINRKKVGFNAPLGIWFQGDLKDFIKDELSESNLKKTGYFNHKAVNKIIEEHNSKRKDYSLHIWAILVFQVWHNAYLN